MTPETSDALSTVPKTYRSPQPLLNHKLLLSHEFGLVIVLLCFGAAFAIFAPGFISAFNLFSLGRVAAVNIVIGFAMVAVITTGGLNLAIGAIGVCVAMSAGWLIEVGHVHWSVAVPCALAVGVTLGAVNGATVVVSGLHSFVVTLATMNIYFGSMLFLNRSNSYRELPELFSTIGRSRIFDVVSPLLLIAIATALGLAILYRLTATGRAMLATGANEVAARLSGIRTNRSIVYCHALSGLLAGVAGLMLLTRTGAAIPSMTGQVGQDWLLPAFLGPVLGGAALNGGKVPVLGTVLGALLLTLLSNGMLLLRVGEFMVQACLGALLLTAVLLGSAREMFLSSRKLL